MRRPERIGTGYSFEISGRAHNIPAQTGKSPAGFEKFLFGIDPIAIAPQRRMKLQENLEENNYVSAASTIRQSIHSQASWLLYKRMPASPSPGPTPGRPNW